MRLTPPRRFRRLNKLYANVLCFFWLPCPRCGEMFGGHEPHPKLACETMPDGTQRVICWRHA